MSIPSITVQTSPACFPYAWSYRHSILRGRGVCNRLHSISNAQPSNTNLGRHAQNKPHNRPQIAGRYLRPDFHHHQIRNREYRCASRRKYRHQGQRIPLIGKVTNYLHVDWVVGMSGQLGRIGGHFEGFGGRRVGLDEIWDEILYLCMEADTWK